MVCGTSWRRPSRAVQGSRRPGTISAWRRRSCGPWSLPRARGVARHGRMVSAHAHAAGRMGNRRGNGHRRQETWRHGALRPSPRPTAWWPPRWRTAGRRPCGTRGSSRRRRSASGGRRPQTSRPRRGSGAPRGPPLSLPGGRRPAPRTAIGHPCGAGWSPAWWSTSHASAQRSRSPSRGRVARGAITRSSARCAPPPSGATWRPAGAVCGRGARGERPRRRWRPPGIRKGASRRNGLAPAATHWSANAANAKAEGRSDACPPGWDPPRGGSVSAHGSDSCRPGNAGMGSSEAGSTPAHPRRTGDGAWGRLARPRRAWASGAPRVRAGPRPLPRPARRRNHAHPWAPARGVDQGRTTVLPVAATPARLAGSGGAADAWDARTESSGTRWRPPGGPRQSSPESAHPGSARAPGARPFARWDSGSPLRDGGRKKLGTSVGRTW